MQEVEVDAIPLARLETLLAPDRVDRLRMYAARARELLAGRVVWNVNATAQGGGVAEMLQALLAYARGAHTDTRWLTLNADPAFFAITKRLHNQLHGAPGDGGDLGDAERVVYEKVLAENLESLRSRVRAGDIVLLHDPQTAGLVDGIRRSGAYAVWRCHIGRDTPHPLADRAWDFLRDYVEPADAVIFSRAQYPPAWVSRDRLWVIPPSLDPFTAKNVGMEPAVAQVTLQRAGLVATGAVDGSLRFTRRDGSDGFVREHYGLLREGGSIPGTGQVVLQVSRWDRLKDMQGVMIGFVEHLDELPETAHLLLAGPDVSGVTDDPEGAAVLAECLHAWRDLPAPARSRVHLACLPMDDIDENAYLVNALQRHASVVVQKSLVEGFGLTVTEPMWKGRPVVASAVGGIQDQIEDGVSGLLLPDPNDHGSFGREVSKVLHDAELSARLGTAAHSRVQDRFLGDRHLIQYVDLFETLIGA
ncbi:glycosyltransferase [Nocardioides mesophilus]|uniref:Glycosyltransferase n=1 Tax=Nocardioides mesophilus TaxID=433659 RepID=A0A7G9RDF9_9ACTN|nr:glycosyltransferase [Nocardioides mesophilus]QNN53634.1 glycosyltransferase [Nocardioides mesophilus]